ncbi:hypothetical protein J6590_028697 [Homalodisca vitripennis]|nr:hypothetical protein J6590_028697 [Homalodisca vitripennis]
MPFGGDRLERRGGGRFVTYYDRGNDFVSGRSYTTRPTSWCPIGRLLPLRWEYSVIAGNTRRSDRERRREVIRISDTLPFSPIWSTNHQQVTL